MVNTDRHNKSKRLKALLLLLTALQHASASSAPRDAWNSPPSDSTPPASYSTGGRDGEVEGEEDGPYLWSYEGGTPGDFQNNNNNLQQQAPSWQEGYNSNHYYNNPITDNNQQSPQPYRAPPPPAAGGDNMNNQQDPPPPQQPQSKPQLSTNLNLQDNDHVPIDYAFPSKNLEKKKRDETKGSSFFSFGRKKKHEEDSNNPGPQQDKTSESGEKQEDWFDISSKPPPQTFEGEQNKQEVDDADPSQWVDPAVRQPRREEDKFASPRRDAVARYMAQSIRHRMVVYFWATCVGAALGGYVGQSLLGAWHTPALVLGILFGLTSCWGRGSNPFGEWARAAGLACWWTLQQSQQVRRDYPTTRHFLALIGARQRQPFPPLDENNNRQNLWTYRPSSPSDPAFEMAPALACMVLVGSAVGGSIPMIPSWMGALVGAASLALVTTRPTVRGDLCRTAGMRIRSTFGVAWQVMVDDVQLPTRTGRVTRKVLDKLLILDRQHKLQDKLMNASSWLFNLVQKTVRQARGERVSEGADDDNEVGDERDGDDRRRRPPPGREDGPRRRGPPPRRGDERQRENDEDRRRRPPPDGRGDGRRPPPQAYRRDGNGDYRRNDGPSPEGRRR